MRFEVRGCGLEFLFCVTLSTFADAPSLDPTRSHLDGLGTKKTSAKFDDFVEPFLVTQTAVFSERPAAESVEKLNAYLKKARLPFKAHFKSTETATLNEKTWPLPERVSLGDQLEGIKKCNQEYCAIKLQVGEIQRLEKSKDKLKTYHEVLLTRMRRFMEERALLGYEARGDNRETIKKMLGTLPFMQARYPACSKFFEESFWKGEAPPAQCAVAYSMLRSEVIAYGNSDRMQPIWRIGEIFQIPVGDSTVWVEIPIYSNHYFDASLRVFEVIPIKSGGSILISTDVMEIDELKKSGLIRFLYKGQMQTAVSDYQSEELAQLN